MNNKGFNLFSVLVAAILLMIGTVLISTLISTEDTTSTEIFLMSNNFSLSDAAAIARSDSLQSFNYNFRERLEEYLTYDDREIENSQNYFALLDTDMINPGGELEWDEVVDSFQRVILLTDTTLGRGSRGTDFNAVLRFVSEDTIQQFHNGRYGKYHVSIEDKGTDAVNRVQNALSTAISTDPGLSFDEPFLDIIGCDERNCPVGSFYFNIPLDRIDDATYEALPRIIVKDLVTNEEMKIPLLPRNRIKIYIPLRFFKAVQQSGENLKVLKGLEDSDIFEDAMLGFCDRGCTPREYPTDPITGNWGDSACVGPTSGSVRRDLVGDFVGITDYATDGSFVGQFALNAYAKREICGASYAAVHRTSDDQFLNYNYNEVDANPPGLAAIDGTPNPIDNCPFYYIDVESTASETKTLEGTSSSKLYCRRIQRIEADVVFKETNPLFIVSDDEVYYKIRIRTKIYPDPGYVIQRCNQSGDGASGTCSAA
jgi:hypothetical protein